MPETSRLGPRRPHFKVHRRHVDKVHAELQALQHWRFCWGRAPLVVILAAVAGLTLVLRWSAAVPRVAPHSVLAEGWWHPTRTHVLHTLENKVLEDAHGPLPLNNCEALEERQRHKHLPARHTLFTSLWVNQTKRANAVSETGASLSQVPADFDPAAYVDYNIDILPNQRGLAGVLVHFRQHRNESRVYTRLRVVLRYTACGGLTNQVYSHIAALLLARELGCDVVLPAATRRDSFNLTFSMDPSKTGIQWRHEPFSSLFDQRHILDFLAAENIAASVSRAGPDHMPDLSLPKFAYQHYSGQDWHGFLRVRLSHVYTSAMEMAHFKARVRDAVVGAMMALRALGRVQYFPPVLLDLPCTLFAVKLLDQGWAPLLVRNWRFSPQVERAAAAVLRGMRARTREFHGLHFRLEADAAEWFVIMGGREVYLSRYVEAARQAGFNANTTLYLATGLLSYSADSLAQVRQIFSGLVGDIYHKGLFLTPQDLQALHPEQLGAVDLLVLLHSQRFVGISISTFSMFVRELRHVLHISPRSSTVLAHAEEVRTDPLFSRSAVFA